MQALLHQLGLNNKERERGVVHVSFEGAYNDRSEKDIYSSCTSELLGRCERRTTLSTYVP